MAAVLLAVEFLLFEWKPRSLIPATLAALLRPYLLGSGARFPVVAHGILSTADLLCAVVVGLRALLIASTMAHGFTVLVKKRSITSAANARPTHTSD